MDYKRSEAPRTTVTRDFKKLDGETGNIYKSVIVIAKRSNQINQDIKEELLSKLDEFATKNDSLEEVFENNEQIDVSRFYESLPKPTLIATDEMEKGEIYFRDANSEK
jgi:DNA-directed RNA polymerase subunit K/omega